MKQLISPTFLESKVGLGEVRAINPPCEQKITFLPPVNKTLEISGRFSCTLAIVSVRPSVRNSPFMLGRLIKTGEVACQ